MKQLPIYLLSLVTLVAPLSWAERYKTVDYARVTSATPVYRVVETRNPVQHCWNERVRVEHPQQRRANYDYQHNPAGTLVGGLVGGAVGNAIGRSHGHERTGTVIGAVVGASIGSSVRHHAPRYTEVGYRTVERCEVQHLSHKERVLEGYDVTYRYQGKNYHTRTRNHPGKRIKVALTVRPLEH